tara:strand:+ start:54 stop:731 length:678 start_codon:yes stop_codon:yes gene_type:complete
MLSNLLNSDQIEKVNEFANLIYSENKKFNLTGLKNIEDIKNILIYESIHSLNYANLNLEDSSKVIDLGTGAGIPGIPFKIMYDKAKLILVDSNHKKCNFIEKVIKELGIDIKIICKRIEEIAHQNEHRESYDICLSRAVSNISTLNEFSLPLLKLDGMSICIKGNHISNEIISSEYSAKVLGGEMINYSTISDRSTIVVYKKIKKTPSLYPRKTGIPKKSPLELS